MKCDCRLYPTWTFNGKTICANCGEPTQTHLTGLAREQIQEEE